MPAAKPGVIIYSLPVQARLGCAALLMHAAGFSQKPLQLFAEVLLKVSLFPLVADLWVHSGKALLGTIEGVDQQHQSPGTVQLAGAALSLSSLTGL